jgi:tRNA (cytidine32/uridine32-2'-O)-methyltransferase
LLYREINEGTLLQMADNKKIRIVLLNTTHPGNVGASARAMKNMNLEELYLVSPHNYPHQEALARASGAEDILEKAVIVASFQEAIRDCHLVFGTSARKRSLPIPLLSVREAAMQVQEAVQHSRKVAILFGQERIGLTNGQLEACHYHLMIPCNPQFASLNLAAAVQIVAYELNLVLKPIETSLVSTSLVDSEAMALFYQQLQNTLIKLEFLNPAHPRQLMRKLKRLFNRVAIEENEMNILRGILTMINRKCSEM